MSLLDPNAMRYGNLIVDDDGQEWIQVAQYGAGTFGVVAPGSRNGAALCIIQIASKASKKKASTATKKDPPPEPINPFA
jgi:hypothetical protein